MAKADTAADPVHSIIVELWAFDHAGDWFTRAMHLNAALLHAVGQRHLPQDIRERLAEAERRFLASRPEPTT